ncbi:MAG TPA: hypothetical protein VEV17_02440 [Bryobacteraceae bacterium]|nr:hypothetical protein [Bryobacteraceae bacterium]
MHWSKQITRATLHVLDRFAAAVESHKILAVLCYGVLFLLICSVVAATKPMWFDELATYYPARLPTVGALLDFFWRGLDVHTATTSLVLRVTMRAFGDGPVTDRMPFAMGYLVLCMSIFIFVVRRCPAIYAAAAMILPMLTASFYFATEIRCYGLLLGFTGIALVSWQAAAEGSKRKLAVATLFLSLAGTICCHYYALFLWVPLGLAELTRWWLRKRLDWPVCLALVLSALVILLFIAPIQAARGAYVSGIWSRAHLGQIRSSYNVVLGLSSGVVMGGLIAGLLLWPGLRPRLAGVAGRIPPHEWVLVASLALLPVYEVPASKLVGVFVERYALACVAGITILLVFAVCRAVDGNRAAGALLVIFLVGWVFERNGLAVRSQMLQNGGFSSSRGEYFRTSDWARIMESSSLPIAAAGPVFFTQFQHYAAAAVQPRITYLASESLALHYLGNSSTDTNLLRFSSVLPLRVSTFEEFTSHFNHFLLCVETKDRTGWTVQALLAEGAELHLLADDADTHLVFDVKTR